MKVKHWIVIVLLLIGGLFLWHNYQGHGGFGGIKTGLGIG